MVLILSAALAVAQPDIKGPPVVEPTAPASAGPVTDAPDPSDLKENPPPAPQTVPAPSPAPTEPGDINAPNDPPPLSDLFPNGAAPEEAPPDMSQNVTINLLKIFVQKGYLSQMEAVGLIRQAENEAITARTAAKAKKEAEAAEEDEAMKVSYVPESVRKEMRDEIRRQVLADIGAGQPDGKNSAVALALPRLDDELDIFGDIRLRYELIQFPDGNDNTGSFPNFNSINTGAPFDTSGLVFSPQRNVDQERMRFRQGALWWRVAIVGRIQRGHPSRDGRQQQPRFHQPKPGHKRRAILQIRHLAGPCFYKIPRRFRHHRSQS